jgi:Zn-dependent M16 (insulinase) family peptidase
VDYETSKESFSKDIHDIAESFVQFGQASKEYNQRAASNQLQFESATTALKGSMEEEARTLRLLLDGIFVEARNTEVQAAQSQKMNEKYLEVMSVQIDKFSQELTARNKEFTVENAARNKELFEGLSTTISEFVRLQSAQIKDQNDKVGAHSLEILQSMEKASQDIRTSSGQIRLAFDELEAARVREEEAAKGRKSGLFGRKG